MSSIVLCPAVVLRAMGVLARWLLHTRAMIWVIDPPLHHHSSSNGGTAVLLGSLPEPFYLGSSSLLKFKDPFHPPPASFTLLSSLMNGVQFPSLEIRSEIWITGRRSGALISLLGG